MKGIFMIIEKMVKILLLKYSTNYNITSVKLCLKGIEHCNIKNKRL